MIAAVPPHWSAGITHDKGERWAGAVSDEKYFQEFISWNESYLVLSPGWINVPRLTVFYGQSGHINSSKRKYEKNYRNCWPFIREGDWQERRVCSHKLEDSIQIFIWILHLFIFLHFLFFYYFYFLFTIVFYLKNLWFSSYRLLIIFHLAIFQLFCRPSPSTVESPTARQN